MVTNNNCDESTAASGKILQGQGIGTASNYSTATYPSTATGTGKILRADGTNWVASTATYPDTAGTSGNVLTSDGTNWSSSAPAASGSPFGTMITTEFNPTDGSTNFLINGQGTNPTATAIRQRTFVTKAMTLNKVYGTVGVSGTLGSNENVTFLIRVNDTTNTNILTTLKFSAATNNFSITGIGLALSAGDFFCFGFTGPTWATNPTGVSFSIAWSS